MDDTITVETTRSVWIDGEGVCIKIGVDRDIGDLVELYTNDAASVDYFGEVKLVMSPKLALLVGQTLVKQALEMGAGEG